MPQGQFPTILAGQDITALLLQLLAIPWARKDANTPVSNNATVANDPDLFIPMAANANFAFVGTLFGTGVSGSGDVKVAFTWPTAAQCLWWLIGFGVGGTAIAMSHGEGTAGAAHAAGTDGSNISPLLVIGGIQNGAVAGNLQLQWAQNTSNATATTIRARSWLAAIRTA